MRTPKSPKLAPNVTLVCYLTAQELAELAAGYTRFYTGPAPDDGCVVILVPPQVADRFRALCAPQQWLVVRRTPLRWPEPGSSQRP